MRTLAAAVPDRQAGDRPDDYHSYPEDDRDVTGAYERLTNTERLVAYCGSPSKGLTAAHDPQPMPCVRPCTPCLDGDHERCSPVWCYGCAGPHRKHGVSTKAVRS